MKKTFENIPSLLDFLENELELPGFYNHRPKTNDDHFTLEDSTENNNYADNKIWIQFEVFNLNVALKNGKDYRKIRKMKKTIANNFNVVSSFNFEQEDEWYILSYEIKVMLRE